MIIFEDKNIHQNSIYPDTDWTGEAKWVIPDENTELCQKAFEYCPYFDVDIDEDGNVIDIIKTETPVEIIKSQKLSELSAICEQTIVQGIDYNDEHYSLTINDQINMEVLKNSITDTTINVPYHPDGKICRLYTVNEFLELHSLMTEYKMYHTTYFNQLKDMINGMNDVTEINACYYGMELDDEHKSNLLNITNL